MKNTNKIPVFLSLVSIFSVCSLSSCSEYKSFEKLKYIKVSDARSLFIGDKNLQQTPKRALFDRNVEESNNVLYKINEDGSILKVDYQQEDGSVIELEKDLEIIKNVNDDYVFLAFDSGSAVRSDRRSLQFLLNKKTNRCYQTPAGFQFADANMRYSYDYYLPSEIFCSVDENIFYCVGEYEDDSGFRSSRLCRVDLSNPDDINIRPISANTDEVVSFVVDKEGNAVYYAENNGNDVHRYVTKDGKYKNIKPYGKAWLGYDGKIYCRFKSAGIQQIFCENDTIQYENYSDFEDGISHRANDHMMRLDAKEKIVHISENRFLNELYNKEHEFRQYELKDFIPELISLKYFASSDDSIFISGLSGNYKPFFGKLTPTDNDYTWTDFNLDDIEVTSIYPNNNGSVSFSGIQLNNVKYAVGSVSNSGEVDLILSDLQSDIMSMIAIN